MLLCILFAQEAAHGRLMKERDVDEERKRKNTQVRRSASIYGDNKYESRLIFIPVHAFWSFIVTKLYQQLLVVLFFPSIFLACSILLSLHRAQLSHVCKDQLCYVFQASTRGLKTKNYSKSSNARKPGTGDDKEWLSRYYQRYCQGNIRCCKISNS